MVWIATSAACGLPSINRTVASRAATVARAAPGRRFDLMLQQAAGLLEQIEFDQPVRQAPHDVVAAAADRGELLEVEIQRQRLDPRKGVAVAGEKQVLEQPAGVLVHPHGRRRS